MSTAELVDQAHYDERHWQRDSSGLYVPGPTFGVPGPLRPSAGGHRVQAFLERDIRQSKGRWRGKPLELRSFQLGLIHELFRTVAGRRIYHEALIGLPRKNGKSTLLAALALYLLLLDGEPAPEVYSAAGDRQQARIVFSEAARMVRSSPQLSEWCRVLRNEIVVDSLDGVYRAISADAGLAHGSNPSAYVLDELHVLMSANGAELYYALNTGMDARENPLGIAITTAGYDRSSVAYEVYERGLEGNDDRMLMAWWGAPENAAIDDRGAWRTANPAPWITMDRLERAYKRLPASVFSRLHLNRWTDSEHLWLPVGAWDACRGKGGPRDSEGRYDFTGEQTWIGVDIGLRHDSSAIVEVTRRETDRGPIFRVRLHLFEPAEQGGVLDLSIVERKLLELAATRSVVSCRYDPHFFQRSAEELSDRIPMEEFPMSNARTAPASQELYTLIVEHRIEHDGDRELAAHVQAAAVRETERGWRISKSKSKRRIDALVAMMLGVSGAAEPQGSGVGARFFS